MKVSLQLADVGGPSAGLLFTLGIIDKIDGDGHGGDLTGGRTIAGTGTIDASGKVGAVGGVPLKEQAARRDGATVFLVPRAECSDATAGLPGRASRARRPACDTLDPAPCSALRRPRRGQEDAPDLRATGASRRPSRSRAAGQVVRRPVHRIAPAALSCPWRACSTSGMIRSGTGFSMTIAVEARTMPSKPTTRSITRWRSALERATSRHSMSPCAGRGVQLQHLGHGRQVRPHVGALALLDLQRGERGHRVAERRRVHLRAEAADHPVAPAAGRAGPAPCRAPPRAAGTPPAPRSAAPGPAARSAARPARRSPSPRPSSASGHPVQIDPSIVAPAVQLAQ